MDHFLLYLGIYPSFFRIFIVLGFTLFILTGFHSLGVPQFPFNSNKLLLSFFIVVIDFVLTGQLKRLRDQVKVSKFSCFCGDRMRPGV